MSLNQVTPAAGIIKPEQSVEVSVRHEDLHPSEESANGIPQNWWNEDTRDKEVILVVHVQGSSSVQTSCQQIHVRHCISAKTVQIDSKSNGARRNQIS